MKWILTWVLLCVSAVAGHANDQMRLAVTTSFHNSGLAEVLLPEIAEDLGLDVQLLVVGTGQAIKLGEAGDVDAILVHSRKAEDAFIARGFGTHRRDIMFNDFIILGPESDTADIRNSDSASEAFSRIAETQAIFVSRGDDSGTHKKELSLWASANKVNSGAWYRAVGAGMGSALNTASGMGAYILSDRASWLNFGNKGGLGVLFEGDPVLFNQYAYLPVNSDRHPHVDPELTAKLEAWLTSDRARELINGYKIDGHQLFTFNAS